MITCRVLAHSEIRKYEQFLKARDKQSISMYFGYPITDAYIEQLVDQMDANPTKHRVVVAENSDLEIVGTVHIANVSTTEAEFGVMVAESHRGQGVSSQMMEYALTWCRNRFLRDIYMHCLSHNAPILHLVRKYGLEVHKEYGDADARVTLPLSNIFSWSAEAFLTQQNQLQRNILSFKKMVDA